MIDAENGDGGPAERRTADEHRAGPAEVPRPLVTTRIEEPNFLPGLRVSARQIRPLAQIARVARQCAVVRVVAAAVLPGDDVLDVERPVGVVVLMDAAVFAAPAGPPPD